MKQHTAEKIVSILPRGCLLNGFQRIGTDYVLCSCVEGQIRLSWHHYRAIMHEPLLY